MTEKLYNDDGEVAIAVSHGFGAGWSTWGSVDPLDARFNRLIMYEMWEEAEKLADSEGLYTGGLRDCRLHWLKPGTRFRIEEYDGAESLVTEDTYKFGTA